MLREPVSRRQLVAGVVALVAVAGLGAGLVWAWPRLAQSPWDRAQNAYRRSDWATAAALARSTLEAHPGDPKALQLLARAQTRLGHDADAVALFERLGAGSLEAGDLFLLGTALDRLGQPALAASAFDTALDLQPGHAESLQAQARLDASRTKRADVALRAERLNTVRSPRARVTLVLGLAGAELARAGSSAALFEKLLARDRESVRRVDSPAAARKLLARLLLEAGRPEEARKVLELLLSTGSDPESQWLLSRAHLQRGALDQARASLARAGDFGAEASGAAIEPAPFVGSAECVACHGALCQSYGRGRHAHTLRIASELPDLPLPKAPFPDAEEPRVSYTIQPDGQRIRVTAASEGQAASALVTYLVGSGRRGTTFLVRDDLGTDRKMRVSHYVEEPTWDFTDSTRAIPEKLADYLGMALSHEGLGGCLNCHATVGSSVRDRSGPEAADKAIGCERCHGPAGNHVKAVAAGFPELAIGELGLASPAEQLAVCAQCHRSDGTLEPSDPGFVRFQTPNLIQSRCFTASGGRLVCITCHSPHRDLSRSTAAYEAKCLVCHGPASSETKTAPRESVAAKPFPVNPCAQCIGGHMPKVRDVPQHASFTDHFIRVHREPQKSGNAEK